MVPSFSNQNLWSNLQSKLKIWCTVEYQQSDFAALKLFQSYFMDEKYSKCIFAQQNSAIFWPIYY